jgi:translocator protein
LSRIKDKNVNQTKISLLRDLRLALIALATLAITSLLGQIATYPNLAPWYLSLAKPFFNPPNWIFAPVWTSLYLLMAFSFWRILRLPNSRDRNTAVLLFVAMLVLNASWSWMFFAANSPLLGLLNIVPQLAIIVAVIAVFTRLDAMAGLSLFPLAIWVAFASVLNASIWQLNP